MIKLNKKNQNAMCELINKKGGEKVKRIIVACNNGVATSQTIVSNLENMLEEKGVNMSNVELLAVDIKSIDSYLYNADAYVCTIRPDKEYDVPMVDGIKFLVGIGADEELEKLINIINS